ncbi:MAG: VCBS repeat-containing protein [Pseudomonadota bacterium]
MRNKVTPGRPKVVIHAMCMALLLTALPTNASDLTLAFNAQTQWLALRLPNSGGQVAVVGGRDDRGQPQLAIAHLRSTKLDVTQIALPQDTVAIDVGPVDANTDALFILAASGVYRLDGQSTQPARVADAPSIFRGRSFSALTSAIDFARDIDGDEAAELLVPDFDTLRIFDDTTYAALGTPALPSVRRSYENAVSYRPPKFAAATAQGAAAILAIRGNDVHWFGRNDGAYARESRVRNSRLGLASERDIEVFYNGDDEVDQSDVMLREAELLRDINGDGLPDLVTLETRSNGVFDKTSTYRFHKAIRDNDTLRFAPEPNTTLVSTGYQFGLTPITLDDAHEALVSPSIKIGLRSIISALFAKSVTLRVSIYATNDDGDLPAEPTTIIKEKIRFDFSSGQVELPTIEFGDMDGDGKRDLILKSRKGQLAWRRNLGAGVFSNDQQLMAIDAPANGEQVGVVDLNGDGKDDLIVRYGPADGEDRQRRIAWITAP